VDHLTNPQAVVPESVMPKFSYLLRAKIDGEHIAQIMATHKMVGVPYTDEMIAASVEDFQTQADPNADSTALLTRYGKATVANFDGQPDLTEMDALIAYLQVLGTMVDFSTFVPDPTR
jgi:cytochrome c oxidase cbb3-type subunit 2